MTHRAQFYLVVGLLLAALVTVALIGVAGLLITVSGS